MHIISIFWYDTCYLLTNPYLHISTYSPGYLILFYSKYFWNVSRCKITNMLKRPPTSDLLKFYSSVKKPVRLKPRALLPASYVTIQQAAGSCWTGLRMCLEYKIKPTSYDINCMLMELYFLHATNDFKCVHYAHWIKTVL